jgi:hypothetical protein
MLVFDICKTLLEVYSSAGDHGLVHTRIQKSFVDASLYKCKILLDVQNLRYICS